MASGVLKPGNRGAAAVASRGMTARHRMPVVFIASQKTLPMALTLESAREQYRSVDLSGYNANVTEDGSVRTLSFTKRTGTKGND